MADLRTALYRRSRPRSPGNPVDPRGDLTRYEELLDKVPVDYPHKDLLGRTHAQLTQEAFGRSAELDLHLGGPGVDRHTTDAQPLGNFLRALDAAANAVAKSLFNLQRLSGALRVTPSPGSVRLVVEPPEGDIEKTDLRTERAERVEAVALRRIVALMEVAARDSDPLSQDLAAALYDLTSSARAAVYRLARSAQAGRYELSGTWLDPRYGSTPVRLSLTAASRLERAAKEKTERVEHEALVGEIDGWQWSSSTVRFKPQQGRAFRAVVPEQLAQQVAQLLSQRGRRVGARFAVLTAYSGRDRRASHKGYALETIRVLDGNDASQPE